MAGHSLIQHVGFRLSGDEEHKRDGYAPVNSYELFSPAGQPVPGGVYDLRLGTTDHTYLCLTCVNGKKLCPGHRGNLTLRVGVSQPIAIAEIRRWLRVACLKCGEVVVDREKYAHLPAGKRLAEAATADTAGKRCPRKGCGAVHPKITKDEEDHFTFWAEPPALEKCLQDFVTAEGIKVGQIIHILRLAVTGKTVGFGLYETMAILGKDSVLARIDLALREAGK